MYTNNFFEKLQNSRKKKFAFAVISMCTLLFLYVFALSLIAKDKALTNYIQFDNKVLIKIEELDVNEELFSISGWLMSIGKEQFVPKVALRATDGEEILIMDTELFERTDIEQIYSESEVMCSLKGYCSKKSLKSIKKDNCYEIVFVYTSDSNIQQSISSKCFYYAGEIYDYNPLDFEAPIFSNLNLLEVINNGNICASDTELGVFVYQYSGQLYWIINKESSLFSDSGRTEIPFHITAFSKKDLPASRRQYGFDNKDFFFEDNEYHEEGLSDYRVSIVDIPQEYMPLHITTGVYDSATKKWKWKTSFQAMTIFEQ